MHPIFKKYKSVIDSYLLTFLDSKKESFAAVNDFGPDAIERIKKMVVAGKTIRGSLVLLSYSFSNTKLSEEAIKAAAAMELFQTALVVHDDIMDRDSVRRGQPAMHVQYKSDNLAMCVGDILFFLAFELLGQTENSRAVRLAAREYEQVGVAQMMDISRRAKTREQVFSLYTNKTARYTFALPLMLGTVIAGTTKEILRFLESYGVAVGVLFQIRDDALDREKNLFTQEDIRGFRAAAEESVARLTIGEKHKTILRELMQFAVTRKT